MIGPFRLIDDMVFDARYVGVQALANRLQYYLDVSPMAVARICHLLLAAFAVLTISYFSLPLFPGAVLVLIEVILAMYTYNTERKTGFRQRNPERMDSMFMSVRLFLFVLFVFLVFSAPLQPIVLVFILPVSGRYFSAADQLPPSERYRWRKTVAKAA